MAAQTTFSSIKRMFVGEHTSAANKFQNRVKEMIIKYCCTTCLDELHKIN